MQSFTDRLNYHFGHKLQKGEELYTRENLRAIDQIKSLIDEDLTFLLHKLVLLDLKVRLTTEGQKKLDEFIKRTEEDKWFNETVYPRFAKIVDRGFTLFLFAVLGDFEKLTGTSGHTKNFIPLDLHKEYLEENPELASIFERSCKAEKSKKDSKKKAKEKILKDGYVTLREPYCKPEKVSLDDPRAVAFLETLTPSEKGADN